MADRYPQWRTRPTWVWWSSGKDSAWALQALQADSKWEVRGLLALVNERNGRAAMHGVRNQLLERQAAAVGMPLRLIEFDWTASSSEQDAAVRRVLTETRNEGAEFIAFGDLSSTRRRERRSRLAEDSNLTPAFPLWGRDSRDHVDEMFEAGLSARVCSVDTGFVGADRVGRRYDENFLADLPGAVDPCGEDDEFHTFVEWAPGWNRRVRVEPTRAIERYGLGFAELEPASTGNESTYDSAKSDPFEYFARLRRVRVYVDAHLDDELDRSVIAAVATMTPAAFSHFFHEHVGMTLTAWLTRLRVERAARMLHEHNHTVSRVAQATGFHNERSFRRAFRRQMGCSPSAYKRRM